MGWRRGLPAFFCFVLGTFLLFKMWPFWMLTSETGLELLDLFFDLLLAVVGASNQLFRRSFYPRSAGATRGPQARGKEFFFAYPALIPQRALRASGTDWASCAKAPCAAPCGGSDTEER